jgi:hypothetical protein
MQHSAELLNKVLSATPRYATQCEIQAKNFLVDSALCCIARSRLRAVQHSAESLIFVNFSANSQSSAKMIQPIILARKKDKELIGLALRISTLRCGSGSDTLRIRNRCQ